MDSAGHATELGREVLEDTDTCKEERRDGRNKPPTGEGSAPSIT